MITLFLGFVILASGVVTSIPLAGLSFDVWNIRDWTTVIRALIDDPAVFPIEITAMLVWTAIAPIVGSAIMSIGAFKLAFGRKKNLEMIQAFGNAEMGKARTVTQGNKGENDAISKSDSAINKGRSAIIFDIKKNKKAETSTKKRAVKIPSFLRLEGRIKLPDFGGMVAKIIGLVKNERASAPQSLKGIVIEGAKGVGDVHPHGIAVMPDIRKGDVSVAVDENGQVKDDDEFAGVELDDSSLAGRSDDEREKAYEDLLAWYAAVSTAGKGWKTDGIVDEALRLDTELDAIDRMVLPGKFGFRGTAALKKLASCIETIRNDNGNTVPEMAKPMDLPSVSDLIDNFKGPDISDDSANEVTPIWKSGSPVSSDTADDDGDLLGDSFFGSAENGGPVVVEDDIDDARDEGDLGITVSIMDRGSQSRGNGHQSFMPQVEDAPNSVDESKLLVASDETGDDRSSTVISNEAIETAIEQFGKKKLTAIVGGRDRIAMAIERQIRELGLGDISDPNPFIPALWRQLEMAVGYQRDAYAWDHFGDEPPEGMKTASDRETYLVKLATSIITLRDQIPHETISEILDIKKDTEQAKWLAGRADRVLQSLLRDGSLDVIKNMLGEKGVAPVREAEEKKEAVVSPGEVRDEMVDNKGAGRFVEYRYADSWKEISPLFEGYRAFAAKEGLRVFRTVQITAKNTDGGEEFDAIDAILGDVKKNGSEHGGGVIGISFAIIPRGAWLVKNTGDNDPFGERFILTEEGDDKAVRLCDRCLRIFEDWSSGMNLKSRRLIHLVIEGGASVNGYTDAKEIADAIRAEISAASGYEVRHEIWSQAEWDHDVKPYLQP